MEKVLRDIEEINTYQQLYHMTYKKTGLYVIYPFLVLLVLAVLALFLFQRDVVIELTGMISNSETGVVISADTFGRIDYIAVSNHQEVRDGDTILMLDTTDIEKQIVRQEVEIDELNERLSYLEYFESSILEGENLMPSDAFGYSLRIDQHFRSLEADGIALNHMSQDRDENVANTLTQISNRESLIRDYQNFNRLVNGWSYHTIFDDVVQSKVQEFRVNLDTFDDDSEQQRAIFVASTLLQIEQNISRLETEISTLNDELTEFNRNFERDSLTLDNNELSTSENLIIEIFENRENLLTQIQEADYELDSLRDEYNSHTITATADGYFQMDEELRLGDPLNARTEIGRILNINSNNNYLIGHFLSSDFNRVNLGQNVTFTLTDGDNNRHFVSGEITLISATPVQTEQSNFFVFHASIDPVHSDLDLRYGMTGELNIITGRTTIFKYLINRFF